ncbi:hypothetical protein C8J57DRAFT_1507215 [Mycena rebaudengoi]|nr:hypothetical protein C8J57DRAFT_1507215 [Mycena rebaudengoi]
MAKGKGKAGKGKGKAAKGKGKGKGKGNAKGGEAKEWGTDGEPPDILEEASKRLVGLGMIVASQLRQQRLAQLLDDLAPPPPPASPTPSPDAAPAPTEAPAFSTFKELGSRCHRLDSNAVLNDFDAMMAYIEVTLYILWRRSRSTKQSESSLTTLAREVEHPQVNRVTVKNWFTAGTRLIFLASAAGMYIIPLLAACGGGVRNQITKTDGVETIESLGYHLGNPHPSTTHQLTKTCNQITRNEIIPSMVFLRQVSTNLEASAFRVRFPPDAEGVSAFVPFSSIAELQKRFRALDLSFLPLPPQDKAWAALDNPMLCPAPPNLLNSPEPSEAWVAEEIVITAAIDLKATPCPVNPDNSQAFTKAERAKASKAPVARDLADLAERLKSHKGGESGYICVDPAICGGKVLTLRDSKSKLLAMIITNLAELLPHLDKTTLSLVSVAIPGEVYPDNSKRRGYRYLACHFSWYNRYAEKGHSAPKDVHPNYVHNKNSGRVNHSQRVPHRSAEMRDAPDETEILAELIQLITLIVEFHIKKLLPDDYETIKVYVSRLPLNERSHAHPFGGFVVNIAVATRGHRDAGDKLFCVVIPFGRWTGGELCLFEPGFVFRLRPWDIILFPSCDITHFNLDFQGVRLSLVLHSDKHGDHWVVDGNGWMPRTQAEPKGPVFTLSS